MSQRVRTWDGQTWMLDPGALFLDFVYTGDFGVGPWRDGILLTGAGLGTWLAAHLDRRLKQPTPREAESALDLRDSITRAAKAAAEGGQLNDVDLSVIARVASQPDLPPVFPGHEPGERPVANQALSSIARDALVHLRDDRDRLRTCGGNDCPIVFLDVSRGGRRTWCSIARCGNRAKVRAHRTRNLETNYLKEHQQ